MYIKYKYSKYVLKKYIFNCSLRIFSLIDNFNYKFQ